MAAGSIIVDLLMRTGSFETDTARAGKAMQKFQKDAEKVGKAIGLAFTAGVSAIGYMVKSSIDAADHLNDLSKSTGVAVETLGGIGFAASQAGSSLDGAASALGKLNQTLAKAAAGNKEASAALKALGVDAIDPLTGKTANVDAALVQMANTFEKAGDSPEKFRAAAAALGKQYQELVPLLSDGGQALLENIQYYQRFGGVSTETAEKADKFNDELGKLKLLSGAFGRTLASELLVPLTGIAEAFVKAKEKGDGFKGTASGIRSLLVGIADAASFVVNSLEAMSARLSGVIQKGEVLADAAKRARERTHGMDIFGTSGVFDAQVGPAFKKIDEGTAAAVASAQKSYDDFVKRLNEGGSTPSVKKTGRIPGIPSGGSGPDTANAELKKKLDGELKLIRDFGDQQRDVLSFQNRYLEGEYQDRVMSLAIFFSDQQSLRKKALQSTLDEQDKIIAAEQAFAKKTTSPTDRIDAENKIAEAREKKKRATVRSQEDEALALQQNARDVRAIQSAYDSVNAEVLELQGNLTKAAEIKFDLSHFDLKKTFTAEGNAAGLQAVETLRAAAIAQAAFQKASIDSGRTVSALSRAEDYLALAEKQGALGSIGALSKLGEIRKSMIPIMEAQVRAQEAIAAASENPALIENAAQARLELEKLKATLDPLADKFNDLFRTAGGNAIGDFLNGTKSAKDAIKDFGRSISTEINNMIGREFSDKLFGKEGIFGGAGGFMSDLFGGKKDPLSLQTAGINSSLTTLKTSGIEPTITALQRMQQAIDGAALSASGGQAQSGETAILDLFTETDDASKVTADFGKTAASAATDIARMAASASRGGSALGLLPSIISALGGGAGGGSSGWLGAIASAASSYFGGGSSVGVGFDGYRASGGPVMAGQTYIVGERGPERLTMGNQNGRITPNDKMGQRPLVVHVTPPPNMSRQTAMQHGSTIGRAIRATVRVD